MLRIIFTFVLALVANFAFSQVSVISQIRIKNDFYMEKYKGADTIKLAILDTLGRLDTLSLSFFAVQEDEVIFTNGLTKLGDTIRLGGLLTDSVIFTGNRPIIQEDGVITIGKQSRNSTPNLLNLVIDNDTLSTTRGGYINFVNSSSSNLVPVDNANTPVTENTRILFSHAGSNGDYKTAIGTQGTAGAGGSVLFYSARSQHRWFVNRNGLTNAIMQTDNVGMMMDRRLRISYNAGASISSTVNNIRDSSAFSIYDSNSENYNNALVWSSFEASKFSTSGAGSSNLSLPRKNKQFVIDTFSYTTIQNSYTGNLSLNNNPFSKGTRIVFKHLSDYSYANDFKYPSPGDTIREMVSAEMTDLAMGVNGSYTNTSTNHFTQLWTSLPRNNFKDYWSIYGGSDHERFRVTGRGGVTINNTNDTTFVLDSLPLSIRSNSAMLLPKGNTSERPSGAQAGYYRYNTDSSNVEFYNGASWVVLAASDITVNSTNVYNTSDTIDGDRTIGLDTFSLKAVSEDKTGFHVNSKLSTVYPLLDALFEGGKFSGFTSLGADSVFTLNGMLNMSDPEDPVITDYLTPAKVVMTGNAFPFEEPSAVGNVVISEIGIADTFKNVHSNTFTLHKDAMNGVLSLSDFSIRKEGISMESSDLINEKQQLLRVTHDNVSMPYLDTITDVNYLVAITNAGNLKRFDKSLINSVITTDSFQVFNTANDLIVSADENGSLKLGAYQNVLDTVSTTFEGLLYANGVPDISDTTACNTISDASTFSMSPDYHVSVIIIGVDSIKDNVTLNYGQSSIYEGKYLTFVFGKGDCGVTSGTMFTNSAISFSSGTCIGCPTGATFTAGTSYKFYYSRGYWYKL